MLLIPWASLEILNRIDRPCQELLYYRKARMNLLHLSAAKMILEQGAVAVLHGETFHSYMEMNFLEVRVLRQTEGKNICTNEIMFHTRVG